MNEKIVWIEIYFCGYMCMKLWGLELGNSMHLQDTGFTFNLVRKFAFWLWTCFSDTFMPSLNQKSKGRYTYFSSDDNNYFYIRFIHHTFKKNYYCDLWHMLYFQNLNIYVKVYIHYLSEHYIYKALNRPRYCKCIFHCNIFDFHKDWLQGNENVWVWIDMHCTKSSTIK